ncbi:MAG: hypothetical protein AUH75_12140 [Gemmatimonadetes bacterium 13_1_40CM_4_65_7]|nr:MAG: hypothetical protein AUH75_12140 [Gemmatimonadetes bacterium 13_1_40CM_4_65_7]
MPPPQNQECQDDPYGVPAEDSDPGEAAEADLGQNRRHHHEPELQEEECERRADDETALSRRGMYDGHGDHSVRQAQNVVQRGEARHAPEHRKRVKRLAHDRVHQRDPNPNARGHQRAEDHTLTYGAVASRRHVGKLRPGRA